MLRKRGRPAGRAADVLRQQAWVYAILKASGLSLRSLNKQYSSSSNSKYFQHLLAGTNGLPVRPRAAFNGATLPQHLDVLYPGTSRWLTHPLFELLDRVPTQPTEWFAISNMLLPDDLRRAVHSILGERRATSDMLMPIVSFNAPGMEADQLAAQLLGLYVLILRSDGVTSDIWQRFNLDVERFVPIILRKRAAQQFHRQLRNRFDELHEFQRGSL